MKRALALVSLLLAGCGVPQEGGEVTQAITYCPGGGILLPYSIEIHSSAVNPWGEKHGPIVVYADASMLFMVGVDGPSNMPAWYMRTHSDGSSATLADLDKLESYSQSSRNCNSGSASPGGGTSPSKPTDPGMGGVCFDPELLTTDELSAWNIGPNQDPGYPDNRTNANYCPLYGGGDCVPLGCAQLGYGCGYHTNNCGRTIYCGACSCPCGGTYPRCTVCSTF
jgi:hypothetical protein